MDSKTLTLLVVGVAALVIIAIVVVYQFAEQKYVTNRVRENIQKQQADAKADAYTECKLLNSQQYCLDNYYK